MHMLRLYNTYTDNLFYQGHDSAPGLDIMLLKQQQFSVSGQAADPARQHPPGLIHVFPNVFPKK
jgi:hypothetical protein